MSKKTSDKCNDCDTKVVFDWDYNEYPDQCWDCHQRTLKLVLEEASMSYQLTVAINKLTPAGVKQVLDYVREILAEQNFKPDPPKRRLINGVKIKKINA